MVKVSAPGKICIAGEWAVLEQGNPLIVAALDKRVFAKIKESEDEFIHISIKDFQIDDLKAVFKAGRLIFESRLDEEDKTHTIFIKSAIESALKYMEESSPFQIRTWSKGKEIKTGDNVEKVGFGSSAASTVAVTSAVFKFFEKDIKTQASKKKLYKLSVISHYFAQGKVGSGFDIASSVFGGISVYKRFDERWLKARFQEGRSLKEIVNMEWPGFHVEHLEIPDGFNLLLGWTGKPSFTPEMVKRLNVWKKKNIADYERLINQIKFLVEELITAWKENDKRKILELIRNNEDYLRELGYKSDVNIETEALAKLSKIANKNQGAGKLSGAGGGDCGIAVTFNRESSERIKKEWRNNGIYFIDVNLSFSGVKEEN